MKEGRFAPLYVRVPQGKHRAHPRHPKISLTALCTAPATMEHHYTAQVNHDRYGVAV